MGVVRYNVHRSQTAGFTPVPANRVGQPTTTGYTDSGLRRRHLLLPRHRRGRRRQRQQPSAEPAAVVPPDPAPSGYAHCACVRASTVSGSVRGRPPQPPTTSAWPASSSGLAQRQSRQRGHLGALLHLLGHDGCRQRQLLTHRRRPGHRHADDYFHGSHCHRQQPAGPPAGRASSRRTGSMRARARVRADSSGGGMGSISGAAWNAGGRFGSALSFDGVNDSVSVPDASTLDLTNGDDAGGVGAAFGAWWLADGDLQGASGWGGVWVVCRSGRLAAVWVRCSSAPSGTRSGRRRCR